jgi:hypothetical protein
MKRKPLLIALILLACVSRAGAQQGRNCFNTQFDKDATTLNMRNAYLLSYLSTMVYADYIRYLYSPVASAKGTFITGIRNDNNKFVDEFEEKLKYLFTPAPLLAATTPAAIDKTNLSPGVITKPATVTEPAVTFKFVFRCNPSGYDPEAVLISTPTTVYVVFRGTDRVACNQSEGGYTWAEWLSSDFKFFKRDATVMHPQVQGQVHRGMVESLLSKTAGESKGFADDLASSIADVIKHKVTGATKKVWITGHSLGGGHAQLFAMFLKFNYNITAQGMYIYEAPHPGDAKFVTQLNSTIGKNRIQRFEFGDDPIPTLPPQAFLFGRAGVRNYFKDYSSAIQSGSEQIPAVDDLKILCALGNLPGEQIPQFAKFEFPPLCPGSTCFHHPTFVLEAIRHQLPSSSLSSLPVMIPLPLAGDNCNQGDLNKADDNDLINNTATAVENAIANIVYTTGNMIDNLIGSNLPDGEGKYKLICYAFKNSSKKYLKWNGTVNSQLAISTTGSVFEIKHKLTGGYQLFISNGNMAADVKYTLGVPNGEENTNNIIMKSKDGVIGDEETWYFFKVANKTYVLFNWNSRRVLDAPNECLTTSGNCPVNEFYAKDNEPTQVWILEKQ